MFNFDDKHGIYIIDRQEYLYTTHYSLYNQTVDDVTELKVSKVGSKADSNDKVFIFEDGTSLEFTSQNSINLKELYNN